MKKILLACVLATVMVLTMIPVTVQAAPQEGLMSTWYQVMNDDGEPRAEHGGAIGSIMGDGSDFDDLLDPDYTMVVGQVMVPTFEIHHGNRPAGFDFNAVGKGEGMTTMGQDGGNDLNDVFVVFEGTVTVQETADYEFSSTYVDNGCVIIIDDKEVFSFWENGQWRDADDAEVVEGTEAIHLEKGKAYPITVYYVEQGGGVALSMDVSVNGAPKVQMNTLGFKFSYDPDAEPTPEPTVEPTPTPEATEAPTEDPTTEAPVTTAPVTKAPTTSAPVVTTPAGTDAPVEGGFPIWIIIVVAVAVVAIVVVVVIVAKKKK